MVRFRLRKSGRVNKTYSFPYRTLASWCWTENADHEEIVIQAGCFTITIRGKLLERIVQALDEGALELVREAALGISESLQSRYPH